MSNPVVEALMVTMPIPVNDLSRHAGATAAALGKRAVAVLERGTFVLGPEVAEFEQRFADYCGVAYSVGVANGTEALELAMRALGAGPGQQVVVTANAAMYSTTAVLATGATPLFADVDPGTGLLTPACLAQLAQQKKVSFASIP